MTRLDTATGPIFLPGIDSPPGTRLRVRVMAHVGILSRARPEGLSAQTILPGAIVPVQQGDGPGVIAQDRFSISRHAAGQELG